MEEEILKVELTPENEIQRLIGSKEEYPGTEYLAQARALATSFFENQSPIHLTDKYSSERKKLIKQLSPITEKTAFLLPKKCLANLEEHIGRGKFKLASNENELLISFPMKGKDFSGRMRIFLPLKSLPEAQISAVFIENEQGQVLALQEILPKRLSFALNQARYQRESAAQGLGTFGISNDLKSFRIIEMTSTEDLVTFIHEAAHALMNHDQEKDEAEVWMEFQLFFVKGSEGGKDLDCKELMTDKEGNLDTELLKTAISLINKRVRQEHEAWAFTVKFFHLLSESGFIKKDEFADLPFHTQEVLSGYNRGFGDIPSYSFEKGWENKILL